MSIPTVIQFGDLEFWTDRHVLSNGTDEIQISDIMAMYVLFTHGTEVWMSKITPDKSTVKQYLDRLDKHMAKIESAIVKRRPTYTPIRIGTRLGNNDRRYYTAMQRLNIILAKLSDKVAIRMKDKRCYVYQRPLSRLDKVHIPKKYEKYVQVLANRCVQYKGKIHTLTPVDFRTFILLINADDHTMRAREVMEILQPKSNWKAVQWFRKPTVYKSLDIVMRTVDGELMLTWQPSFQEQQPIIGETLVVAGKEIVIYKESNSIKSGDIYSGVSPALCPQFHKLARGEKVPLIKSPSKLGNGSLYRYADSGITVSFGDLLSLISLLSLDVKLTVVDGELSMVSR
jgi:hypothetical protein